MQLSQKTCLSVCLLIISLLAPIESSFSAEKKLSNYLNAIVYNSDSKNYYLFSGDRYAKKPYGKPTQSSVPISEGWKGWPWKDGKVDAAVYNSDKKVYYFFKDGQYARKPFGKPFDKGYPRPVSMWSGWPSEWGSGNPDAVIYNSKSKKYYLFKGVNYTRHSHGGSPDFPPKRTAWSGWNEKRPVTAAVFAKDQNSYYFFSGVGYAKKQYGQGHSFTAIRDTYKEWLGGRVGKIGSNSSTKYILDRLGSDNFGREVDIEYGERANKFNMPSYENGDHIQGLAVYQDKMFFTHSSKGGDGVLVMASIYGNESSVIRLGGGHPGGIQMLLNRIAIPINDLSSGKSGSEIRFIQYSDNKLSELKHLRIKSSKNLEAVAYFFDDKTSREYVIATHCTGMCPDWDDLSGKSVVDNPNVVAWWRYPGTSLWKSSSVKGVVSSATALIGAGSNGSNRPYIMALGKDGDGIEDSHLYIQKLGISPKDNTIYGFTYKKLVIEPDSNRESTFTRYVHSENVRFGAAVACADEDGISYWYSTDISKCKAIKIISTERNLSNGDIVKGESRSHLEKPAFEVTEFYE
ncbi:hemopexin repeat-containing protein [Aestuariirhabdus sp. Z084]|uniref:hemopexin repeat-containing protein n=1 Tax=Aestuariirhabdus haliotis TaxID=2918751 RepID=UPI00201B38D3|nr:hemopexin repeat-containing protein [Aestuariirhabdus haliotis]MCL6415088.1 hemopexin repeat-containing protein [Aestuariirhabdus haliotis]MCL6419020.1 hemopexin repeat-containing protein [Aestuariirhabdus haliotis]